MEVKITYKMEDMVLMAQQHVARDFSAPAGYEWDVSEKYNQIIAKLVKIEAADAEGS